MIALTQQLISVRKQSKQLQSGEVMSYIQLPLQDYPILKEDFTLASHFHAIDELDLSGYSGVLIKSPYVNEGLLAAAYIFRKYTAEVKHFVGRFEDDDEIEDELTDDAELWGGTTNTDFNAEAYRYVYAGERHALLNVPVLSTYEFTRMYGTGQDWRMPHGVPVMGGFQVVAENDTKQRKPYWMMANYPLILLTGDSIGLNKEALEHLDRFVIIVNNEPNRRHKLAQSEDALFSPIEKDLLFSTDLALLSIPIPPVQFYHHILRQVVEREGYQLADDISLERLIEDLMRYRGLAFASVDDVETFVLKALKRRNSSEDVVCQVDFDRILAVHAAKTIISSLEESPVEQEFNRLIGLDSVKTQIYDLVSLLKFNLDRQMAGLRVEETHTSFAFLGNPGTAKTTVARILGKLLKEANVLQTGEFHEVSRKDLVGRYVGWTAPMISKAFDQSYGGILFIDEAYSLQDKDGFGDEAVAQIIVEMENNPQTVVIFAGYPKEMRKFIETANPGLRSRITAMVEFPDYNNGEMFEIYRLLLANEDYTLQDELAMSGLVMEFLAAIQSFRGENIGNGRLMRKLAKETIRFRAKSASLRDLRLIFPEHLQFATESLLTSERVLAGTTVKRIGF